VAKQQKAFKGCKMDTSKIQVNEDGSNTSPALAIGIAKVQQGIKFEATLSKAEKNALKPYLLKKDDDNLAVPMEMNEDSDIDSI
jgi:hypothetical protein